MMQSGELVKNDQVKELKQSKKNIKVHFNFEMDFFFKAISDFAHSKKMSNFVPNFRGVCYQQTETLPFEPDLDHTSVGKSR